MPVQLYFIIGEFPGRATGGALPGHTLEEMVGQPLAKSCVMLKNDKAPCAHTPGERAMAVELPASEPVNFLRFETGQFH